MVSQFYSHIKVFGTKLQLFQKHLSQTEPKTASTAGGYEQLSTGQYQCAKEGVCNRHCIFGFQDLTAFSLLYGLDDVLHQLHINSKWQSQHQQHSLVDFYRQQRFKHLQRTY